jgi:hypothetical protein
MGSSEDLTVDFITQALAQTVPEEEVHQRTCEILCVRQLFKNARRTVKLEVRVGIKRAGRYAIEIKRKQSAKGPSDDLWDIIQFSG